MNLAWAILGLAVLILVHEAGHFFVARAVRMRPRKFYVGFPPPLARVRRNGIEYGIGAIPLGGYVKIPGMHRPAPSDVDLHFGAAAEERPELNAPAQALRRDLEAGEMEGARRRLDALAAAVREASLSARPARSASRGVAEIGDALGPDAYWRAPTWKKLAVIAAGPAVNVLVAIVLFTVLLMQDAYQLGVRLAADQQGGATTRIEETVPGSPAEAAGIRPGDRIVRVDGARVDAAGLLERIQAAEGRPLELVVRRDGEAVALGPVAPRRVGGRSLGEAVGRSLEITGDVTKQIGGFFPRLFTGEGSDEVASVVGITEASSQALDRGVEEFLFILGLVSLSLALLNLLPLLPLDGGHIAFSIVEGVRRRALGREIYERVSVVGIAIVLFLFAIGLSNDIGRLSGG